MTGFITPQLAKLPLAQRQLWAQLGALVGQGFVLQGGTAIALRLGHRDSLDFDFFTEHPLHRASLRSALPLLATSSILQDEPDSFTALLGLPAGEVKVSFFGSIAFGRVGVPDTTQDGIAVIASLRDLLAQKLKVLMQRVEAKDYQDVSAIVRSGVSLEEGMAGAMALFGPNFSPMECRKALVHFQGGDLASLQNSDRTTLLAAVRALPNKESLPLPLLSTSLS